MGAITNLKLLTKQILAPIYFRGYPITLKPERLYLWMDILCHTLDTEGDIIEVGVMHGGTSIIAKKLLVGLGSQKRYYAYDTFSGFVQEQVSGEIGKGLHPQFRNHFQANSEQLVKKIFRLHGVADIKTMKGDIMTQCHFPTTISAALLDVDLAEPTYAALGKVYGRLSDGGVIAIDDCHRLRKGFEGYRAAEGVQRFADERGISVEYAQGMGFISKGNAYKNAYINALKGG